MRIVSAVFIAEFQAALAMYMKRVSIGYGSPFACIGDDHMHHAVGGDRRVPRKRLVDARGPAFGIDDQILGRHRVAERDPRQRLPGSELIGFAGGLWSGWARLWVWRLVTPPARYIDRADQHLQEVQRAAGLEPVRMRRDAAHCMERDRTATHRIVPPSGPIGPRDRQLDLLLERGLGDLGGEPPYRRSRDATGLRHRLGRIARVEIAFRHQLKHRDRASAVGQRSFADQARLGPRRHRARQRARPFEHQGLAGLVAREKPVIGRTRGLDHQPGGVGVAHQVVRIDPVGLEQFVDQRQDK